MGFLEFKRGIFDTVFLYEEASAGYFVNNKLNGDTMLKMFPKDKWVPVNDERLLMAIKYGLSIEIMYKNESIKFYRQRVIYPLTYGFTSSNDSVIIGYQKRGFSFSGDANKSFRQFRVDRMDKMRYTGQTFSFPPKDYNESPMNVSVVIATADFNEIKKNQEELKKSIDDRDRPNSITQELVRVKVIETDNVIDLTNANSYNPLIDELEDMKTTDVLFLQNVSKLSDNIAMINVSSKVNNKLKLYVGNGNSLKGVYKVLDVVKASELNKKRSIGNKYRFDIVEFEKKLN
jgi:hypothetical protein